MGGSNFKSFFLLTLEDDPRPKCSVCSRFDAPGLSEEVRRDVQQFHGAAVAVFHANGSLQSLQQDSWNGIRATDFDLGTQKNDGCKPFPDSHWGGVTLSRWQGQWVKVANAYMMMQKYE